MEGQTLNHRLGLIAQIESVTERYPQKNAVKKNDICLDYQNLSKCKNRVAAHILGKPSVGECIVFFMDRSIELVVSMLGAIKSGKIIVPIDANYPSERIQYMLEQVACNYIVTQKKHYETIREIVNKMDAMIQVECIEVTTTKSDEIGVIIDDYKLKEEAKETIYNEKCYIYFTSGSTGKPKGILGKQSSLLHFIQWEIETFHITCEFHISQLISPSFDPFLRDVFVPLLAGGTLVIPKDQEIVLTPTRLLNWIESEEIHLIHMGKTLFCNMCSELKDTAVLRSLQYILLSGEKLKGVDLEAIYSLYEDTIKVANLYGPTETTLAVSYYITSREDVACVNVPIGKPIFDASLYVYDEQMNECKTGEIGEIYIENPYGTFGYLDTKWNEGRFIEHSSKTLYRTGDLGRRLAGDLMECLGRVDRQVKIDGIRMESGEIEAVLQKLLPHRTVYVTTKETNRGKQLLCAYYDGQAFENERKIKNAMKEKLPPYMIPVIFQNITKFPLLPNGKIAISQLPEIIFEQKIAYENEIQEQMVAIFEDILGVKLQSFDDSFLYLGGNSIDATKVASRIYQTYGVTIKAVDLLRNMTIRMICDELQMRLKENRSQEKDEEEQRSYYHITRQEPKKRYPMSYAQRGVYAIHRMQEMKTSYHVTQAVEIVGTCSMKKIKDAYQKIFEQHAIYRTTFLIDETGEFVQEIQEQPVLDIKKMDLSEEFQHEDFYSIRLPELMKSFVKPFDLEQLPLTRTLLVRLEEKRFIIIKDTHHIITDELSEEIFFQKLIRILQGKEWHKETVNYQDYCSWQTALLDEEMLEVTKQYWIKKIGHKENSLELPYDYKRPLKKSYEGAVESFQLEEPMVRKLKMLSKEQEKTMSTICLTAYLLLLQRYSGSNEVTIGIPCAGRVQPELYDMLGMFVNTLPYAWEFEQTKRVDQVFCEVFEEVLQLVSHQEYPFGKLVEDLHITPEGNRNPLYDVIFNFISLDEVKDSSSINEVCRIPIPQSYSKFDLSLIITQRKGQYTFQFEYSTELFEKQTIQRMVAHYRNLLTELTEKVDQPIGELRMLSEGEIGQVLGVETMVGREEERTVIDYFMEQVEKHPDKVAVIGTYSITYKELERMSNQVADYIIEHKKDSNAIIGVMLKRTPWLFATLLGILRAGYTYVPIDPEYPYQRIEHMLTNSGCRCVFTEETELQGISCWKLEEVKKWKKNGLNQSIRLDGLDKDAYVIYTSGSTGVPKGVVVTSKNVSSFCRAITKDLPMDKESRVLCVTTICFDIFVLESLVPMSVGATVVLASEEEQKSPYEWKRLIQKYDINTIQFTPSRLRLCFETLGNEGFLQSIQTLIVGGEPFDESLLEQFSIPNTCCIYNVYGPTEATVWCCIKQIQKGEKVTIGLPLENTKAYVLSEKLKLQPIGVIGELYLGGDCIAKGYMNMPDKTEERFIKNPYRPTERIYKTGDLVKRLLNGELEYVGRNDFQVKIRGFRIELSEIESTIEQLPEVKQCICHVLEENCANKQLVAYYIANQELEVSEIRMYLAKQLPYYMIPEVYMRIESIPFTLNGKIDKKQLPKPVQKNISIVKEYVKATNDVERDIQRIWQDILKVDYIGIKDNFFELGGNSISLVRMHSKLNASYPNQISVAQVFDHPTIAALATFLHKREQSKKKLRKNQVPEEYFATHMGNEGYELQYKAEEEISNALKMICQRKQIPVEQMMLALYVYAFTIATQKEEVVCYMPCNVHRKRLLQVEIKMSDYEDFFALAHGVREEKQPNIELSDYVTAEDTTQHEMSIMFATDQMQLEELIALFDYCVVAKIEDCISLSCYYRGDKLNSECMEELFGIYIKVLDTFIANMMEG